MWFHFISKSFGIILTNESRKLFPLSESCVFLLSDLLQNFSSWAEAHNILLSFCNQSLTMQTEVNCWNLSSDTRQRIKLRVWRCFIWLTVYDQFCLILTKLLKKLAKLARQILLWTPKVLYQKQTAKLRHKT